MRLVVFLVLLTSLTACEIVDNQKIVRSGEIALANPSPVARDFQAQNKAHKILIAIIDSGVDYNHSKLTSHIHFTLDDKGQPTGAGYDFVADDNWPAPYIVRTAQYDPNSGDDRRNAAIHAIANFERAAMLLPKWAATFLNPLRAIDQEVSAETYHGTHVAGLASYDKDEIGILPYRVVPRNLIGAGNLDAEDMTVVANQLFAAVDRAVNDGASVINLSLGFSAKKNEDPEYDQVKALSDQWSNIVAKYPNILFVAAAGNDGAWIDQKERVNFPCGNRLPNLLCVGSLSDESEISDFTNAVVAGGPEIVFALGENVISTYPEQSCYSEAASHAIAEAKDETEFDKAIEAFQNDCSKFNGLVALSGTSMAAPITARTAALLRIQNPQASPAKIIELIKSTGSKATIGATEISKLTIEKPSWYKSVLPIWNLSSKWKAYVQTARLNTTKPNPAAH